MELIREWLLGVTGMAFLLALAEGLMPEGTAKKVGKLTGGLLLFLTMFRPIAALDFDGLARQLEQYDWGGDTAYTALEEENQKMAADIIAGETAAYIEQKAAALGVDCTAEVTCRRDEYDLQVPYSVRITGAFSAETQAALCRIVEQELDIPAGRQSYGQEEGQ